MIEELTPQVLASSMTVVLLCVSVITAPLSMLFLWRYRRAVARSMAASSNANGRPAKPVATALSSSTEARSTLPARGLYRRSLRAMGQDCVAYSVAILVSALALALAAQVVYPTQLGWPGFVVGTWLYAWPMVPAIVFILPRSIRFIAMVVLGYLLVYLLLGVWVGTVKNIPAQNLGGVQIPERSGVTPAGLALLWLAVNAVPTALCLLCFNRAIRAVAPLLLALVTLLISGLWASWVWLHTTGGDAAADAMSGTLQMNSGQLLAAFLLLSLSLLALTGWCLLRWIARAYRRKSLSDRSLSLDAIYLAFLSTYAMWLVIGGLLWFACIPLAFGLYKLVLFVDQRVHPRRYQANGLCFLRVFALGRHSENLREALARYWRYIGPLQMITGPDVATGTVQPHQFLDYLSGKLDQHFVSDADAVATALEKLDHNPDPDGRFRINNLFCYRDTWQAALPALVESGETLIMDLRGFNAQSAGCRDELLFLAAQVPLHQCLLVVDRRTDRKLLEETLGQALADVPKTSPNVAGEAADCGLFEFEPGSETVGRLVRRLCEMAGGSG